jgi:membrane protein
MRGVGTKCPYCGSYFEKEQFLDKRVNLFNWLFLTVRQLLFIISFNIFVILMIIDIILVNAAEINIHLTPWAFIIIFSLSFIICDFLLKSANKNKLLFLKSFTILLIFSILMMVSYQNEQIFEIENKILLLGYYYPLVILFEFFTGIVRFLTIKKFNIFSTSIYVLILVIFSTILFILSFVSKIGLQQIPQARLLIYICFAISIVVALNVLTLSILKMRSRVSIEG